MKRAGARVVWSWLMGMFVVMVLSASFATVGAAPTGMIRYDPANLPSMYYFHPNETKVLRAHVNNTGDSTDSFELTISLGDVRWSASLDLARVDDLPPGSQAPFNVTLTSPAEARDGWHTSVTLTCRSVLANATEIVKWTSWVVLTHKVELACEEPVAEVASNATATFALDVTNLGEATDTFDLECAMDPACQGWNASPSAGSIELCSGQTGHATVDVTSPPMGTANGTVRVTARCRGVTDVFATVVLTCTVAPEWAASLDPAVSAVDVAPGGSVVLSLNLSQRTNLDAEQAWCATLSGAPPGWLATVAPAELVLNGSSAATLTVNVTAPPRALAGSAATVEVTLTCAQPLADPLVSRLELTVVEVHGICATFSHVPDVPPSASSANVTVSFLNGGNVEEAFELVATLPPGWGMESHMGAAQGPWFTLAPWAEGVIEVRMAIPANATCGTYTVTLLLRSSYAESETASISIDVPRRVGLELLPLGGGEIIVEPGGGTVQVEVSLGNLGNSDESIQVEADCGDAGCSMVPVDAPPDLAPGSTAVVHLALSAGAGAPFGPATATVVARVSGTEINVTLVVEFTVVGPDLEVADAAPLGEPAEGEPIWIAVEVRNVGRGGAGATVLRVRLEGEATPLGNASVPPLAAGASATVNVSVVPPGGNHTYVLELDPDGLLREDGDAPNSLSFAMEATPAPQGTHPGRSPVVLAVVAVAAVAVLVVALLATRGAWSGRARPPSG